MKLCVSVDEDWDEQTAEEDLAFVENPVCSSEDKTERFVESKTDLKFIGKLLKHCEKSREKKRFGIKKVVKKVKNVVKKTWNGAKNFAKLRSKRVSRK